MAEIIDRDEKPATFSSSGPVEPEPELPRGGSQPLMFIGSLRLNSICPFGNVSTLLDKDNDVVPLTGF
jgi:hypothetical protein